ncbi:hypothetical protein BsWGS_25856 [Bradybaena similaris]
MTTVQLTMTTVQPPMTTVQPPMTTVQPPMTTVQPPRTTVQPPRTTVQPPRTTVQPPNSSQLQLYQVLQKANLLKYFETFISQGGDDVQQLCEAGEDEFLEIMALVGMASKPLHVRRLQKALQEWVTNPAAFEELKKHPTHIVSIGSKSSLSVTSEHPLDRLEDVDENLYPAQSSPPLASTPYRSQVKDTSSSDGSAFDDPNSSDSQLGDHRDSARDYRDSARDYQVDQTYSSFLVMPDPRLSQHQIMAIATAASQLAQDLPPLEPKSAPKKPISQEILTVMQMSADEPHRMSALRRFAAIYGRFDSRRKNHKPMNMHEISVNEAAAQLCSHCPALLTRREELFPLARQVVRESGYQYSKGHSRAADILLQSKLEIESDPPLPSTLSDPPLPSTLSDPPLPSTLSDPPLPSTLSDPPLPSTLSDPPLPSTLSATTASPEISLGVLQAELSQVTHELTEITKEQKSIHSSLRVLLESKDHDQMRKLTAKMDILNDRQTAMMNKRQKIKTAIAKCSKSGPDSRLLPDPRLPASPAQLSTDSTNNITSSGCHGCNNEVESGNCLNTWYLGGLRNRKDSIFEEGLRLAKQYGMSDFAEQLIGLKSTTENVGGSKLSDNMPSHAGVPTSGCTPQEIASAPSASSSSSTVSLSLCMAATSSRTSSCLEY